MMSANMRVNRSDLLRRGIYAEKMTPAPRLAALAARLWPVQTDFPLVRIGGPDDGGYLVPDDLDGVTCCFSPGVGPLATFEQHLQHGYGIPSHLADASVATVPQGFVPASFTRKFIGAADAGETMTLDSWVHSRPDTSIPGDLLLQMDIEGDEYQALLATSPELLRRFRIIVVEIHWLENLGCPAFCGVVEGMLTKLLAGFHVVHSHVNNHSPVVPLGRFATPSVLELTLLRKDRSPARGYGTHFPHPLDAPNNPRVPDVVLPPAWRATAGSEPPRS